MMKDNTKAELKEVEETDLRFGICTLDEFNLKGKTVLCRVDFNQPIDWENDALKSTARIEAAVPTVKEISDAGARLVLMAHQGSDIEYENFNASNMRVTIRGKSIHPGSAKGHMINSLLVAMEFQQMLPPAEDPAYTEGYEGFYHLTGIEGDVEHATVSFIVRDHSPQMFEARKTTLHHIEKLMNERYGEGTVKLTVREQYRNMAEKLVDHMHIVENAREVVRSLGKEPDGSPVRGGTDGSELSFRGLPCPNLGTGGYCFHGPLEHISVENMDLCVKILLGIVEEYAQHG